MIVYIVTGGTDYSPSDILRAFTRREKAEAFAAPRQAWAKKKPKWSNGSAYATWLRSFPFSGELTYDSYTIETTELES